jgi:PBP1b-binding outer membrane lipoprotein LpoB
MKRKILIAITAVILVSCASKKVTTTVVSRENSTFEKVADSTSTKQVVKEIKQQPVAADTASASVAISAIENLPEGAKFTEKSGRASVQLIRINDTIIITAICDSLQRLIYSYELEIENYKGKIEQKNNEVTAIETKTKKKTYNPFLAYLLGVGTGGLVVLIFANKKSIFDTVLNIIKKLFK